MIKKSLTVLLTFTLYSLSQAQSINWTLVNTGTTKNIRDVSFINRDTGFIAGDNGLLKMTTDGGSTWSDLAIPSTGQGTGNNGNIKVAQFYDYGGPIAGVLFYDKFTAINRTYDLSGGWMEECGGSMFVSYDSLCSINNFHHSQSFSQYAAAGNCLNGGGQAGWFGGFCFSFDSLMSDTSFDGWVDVTSNANDEVIYVGESGWIAQKAGFAYTLINSGTGYNYLSVDWSDTNNVYAANDSGWWLLEKSTDGGNTWGVDSSIQPTFWYPVIQEMDFTNNDWGVLAGSSNGWSGIIITKRGNNVDFFGTDSVLTSVYVLDSTFAFAGGLNGKLYKYDQTSGMGLEQEINQIDFTIFPNPQNASNEQLNILSNEKVKEVVIYDLTGKVLLNSIVNQQGAIKINTNIHTAGTYLVRITTDKGIGTKKFIVNE